MKICKLSEEKSINKVLNCIVYMCYREPELMDNDGTKNILWNCFEREMIRRAKEDYTDSDLDFSTIVQKAGKTKELKKRKFAKYQKEKEFHIAELEDPFGKARKTYPVCMGLKSPGLSGFRRRPAEYIPINCPFAWKEDNRA